MAVFAAGDIAGEATGVGERAVLGAKIERLAGVGVGEDGATDGIGDVLAAGDIAAAGEAAVAGEAEVFGANQERLTGVGEAATGETDGTGDASFLARLCLAGLAEASAASEDAVVPGLGDAAASFLAR